MEPVKRDNSVERKKDKKKKHDRSRSDERKKKRSKERDVSKQHKKKDKDKKHHKDKDRSRSREREREKDRKDPDREKEKSRDQDPEKQREKDRDRPEKEREKDRDRPDKEREKDRAPKQREKEREKEKQPREKGDREKDPEREKEKQKGRDKEKQREKDRHREKSREVQREREKDRRNNDRRDRSKQRKDRRQENNRNRRQHQRQDKYERWRRERDDRYRFDSPPKSGDESDNSDDHEKMDKLNKMKAEKELVSSKADRKLYLGNLPPNITSNQLMQMLNSALKKMEINTDIEGDSIVSAWVSPDGVGHYAFVEFRTAQEATAGLALNGASLYGYQLKLGRPKQYIEYHKQLLSEFGSDGNIDTILRKVEAMGGYGELLVVEQRLVHPPSKVVVLKHVVTIEQLAIDEEYNQIVEDVTEMAKRHGDVIKVAIPRPMEIDLQEVKKRVKGLGFIFIKYKSVEQARYARREFIKSMFSDRSVACSYFSEKRFDEGDLDPIEKIVIDF